MLWTRALQNFIELWIWSKYSGIGAWHVLIFIWHTKTYFLENGNNASYKWDFKFIRSPISFPHRQDIEGILPKGPYLPCVSMAGRAILAGYHRYVIAIAGVLRKTPTFVMRYCILSSEFITLSRYFHHWLHRSRYFHHWLHRSRYFHHWLHWTVSMSGAANDENGNKMIIFPFKCYDNIYFIMKSHQNDGSCISICMYSPCAGLSSRVCTP